MKVSWHKFICKVWSSDNNCGDEYSFLEYVMLVDK